MKKVLSLFVFVLSAGQFATAQLVLTNSSIQQPEKRILIAGQDNKLMLSGLDAGVTYTIHSTAADIPVSADGSFILHPNYQMSADTVEVFANDELVQTAYFSVDFMSRLMVRLGSITSDHATVGEILEAAAMVPVPAEMFVRTDHIEFFDLMLTTADGEVKYSIDKIEGDHFTAEQIDAINHLNPGDKLIVRNVMLVSNGVGRVIPGVSLDIVE